MSVGENMKKRSFFITISFACLLLGCASTKPTTPSTTKLSPHELIKTNRINEAKNEFVMPNDINGVDSDGNTVLHLAAQKMMQILLLTSL